MTAAAHHDAASEDFALFARATRNTPLPMLVKLIAQTCRVGNGHWQEPAPPRAKESRRPATHLFEIQLFGIHAVGFTDEEAAKNWRNCALAQIEVRA